MSASKGARIVVTEPMDLSLEQRERLNKLGDVTIHEKLSSSPDEWLERCQGADVILTGKFGLKEHLYDLKDVFFSFPFVGVGWIDKKKIQERGITVSYAPGCNRHAVSEWCVGMMINLLRQFPKYMNVENLEGRPPMSHGLSDKRVTVVGKGHIGRHVGEICEALGMQTTYHGRGHNLHESVKYADVVIDCIAHTPETRGIYDKDFFSAMKDGSYFVTMTSSKLWDLDAMFAALDSGKLRGVASDCGDKHVGDTQNALYRKLISHQKVLVTPHIAYHTDTAAKMGNDMMIDNVEAWLKGKPLNILE